MRIKILGLMYYIYFLTLCVLFSFFFVFVDKFIDFGP